MRNYSTFAFALAAVIGATGCAADDMSAAEIDSLEEAGKADSAAKASKDTLFVYDNGIRCITTPCPTLSVVTAPGKTERVTDLVFAGSDLAIGRTGTVVKGKIKKGKNGKVTLTVSKIVGDAPLYDAYFNNRVCFTAPCPSYTVATASGDETDVAGFDFSAAARSEEDEARLIQKMHEGSLIVRGYVAQGPWQPLKSGNILHVTSILESDVVRFDRDSRPVDGDYQAVQLEKSDAGYAATLQVSYYNRLEGREVNETKDLGTGLECTFGLVEIVCAHDGRPYDGILVEVKLVRNAEGTYDVTTRRAWYDRLAGQPREESEEVAFGLAHR